MPCGAGVAKKSHGHGQGAKKSASSTVVDRVNAVSISVVQSTGNSYESSSNGAS